MKAAEVIKTASVLGVVVASCDSGAALSVIAHLLTYLLRRRFKRATLSCTSQNVSDDRCDDSKSSGAKCAGSCRRYSVT